MNNIDILLNRINKENGLNNNDIGVLINIRSMTENSICRIDNKYGGYTQLYYGEDAALEKYAKVILANINTNKLNNKKDKSTIKKVIIIEKEKEE